ncbi:MAG: hypothetical protein GPOALKHO_000559 [Sodalis sp.]|nr:MAG: hypothetical protein GPOALKHO_000559 [Sodalis sp.]
MTIIGLATAGLGVSILPAHLPCAMVRVSICRYGTSLAAISACRSTCRSFAPGPWLKCCTWRHVGVTTWCRLPLIISIKRGYISHAMLTAGAILNDDTVIDLGCQPY